MNTIQINPELPSRIETIEEYKKYSQELEHWINRPYIEASEFEAETYDEYFRRMSKVIPIEELDSQAIFEMTQEDAREAWLNDRISGLDYKVKVFRVSESMSWMFSSCYGHFNTLDEALIFAESLIAED